MVKQKWYLSTWFIALWFAFTYFVFPFFIGLILLVMQVLERRKQLKYWRENGLDDLSNIKEKTEQLEKEVGKLEKKKENADEKLTEVENSIAQKKEELIILEDELLYQSFGFYEPKYGFENSEEYKNQLDKIRNKQKEMVKQNSAADAKTWTVDGSKKKGEVLAKNNVNITMRAFNNECDTAIAKVKFNNIDSVEKQIKRAMEQLNKMNKHNGIEITDRYLSLKIEELYLAYEYQVKKEEEKEEQRRIKEQMKEEKRIQQEIEREKKKLEKDEQHFKNAIDKYKEQLESASEEMKVEIESKLAEIDEKMAEIQQEKEAVDYREQNAKAGYVYIISNIGSFGEDVYKIGMTRRLEPLERISELGNASVPFGFDVHAMVFSEDAPKLESSLHRAFEDYQVNKVNPRKEFFSVTLDEIAKVIKENHNKTVEFTKLAAAEEYRKSLQLNKEEKIRVGA
ncbi:DUF4041 domain-containing protein [Bacillus sp. FJAT-45350]|uniref:DUF4041 domain-containing protein n=1 Tax=Bacillus sp. FJAT-45350 TaxID=2011014 RepID=UPI000BB6A725|nr:DUF4041 domain-containing protein [Bacillus sp. FJAT-45350]